MRRLIPGEKETNGKTLGEQPPASQTWSDQVLHTVRHEGCEPFFDQLADWRSRQRGGKRKAANGLLKYAAQREEIIRYDECDKRGRDVGSGPMESMCGVTTDRIKGRGRRWGLDYAESLMAHEALYQSRQRDQYGAKAFGPLELTLARIIECTHPESFVGKDVLSTMVAKRATLKGSVHRKRNVVQEDAYDSGGCPAQTRPRGQHECSARRVAGSFVGR